MWKRWKSVEEDVGYILIAEVEGVNGVCCGVELREEGKEKQREFEDEGRAKMLRLYKGSDYFRRKYDDVQSFIINQHF
jgi:hypothetical protein